MNTNKPCICNARFALIFVICIILIGAIGYVVYKNDVKDTIAVDAQHNSNLSTNNYTQATVAPVHITTQNIYTQASTTTTTIPQILLWEQNEEIRILREYLQIPTPHPDVDYKPCVKYLKDLAASLSLPVAIYYPIVGGSPVVVITWEGTQPELPSIVLNSHMDVVPVFPEFWTHPPFAAEMEANGDIYARGAQDTKSLGMQYLAAIRALKRDGIDRLKRTIHVFFVPDEEIGGSIAGAGMAGFVKTNEFKALNVGFLWDEGGATANDGPLIVTNGERTIWQIEFVFIGRSGHGSKLFEDTPGQKLNYVIGKFMELRKDEVRKLNELKYPYGNVTSINLTKVKGGVENNVIPAEMRATFDIRISINADLDDFERQIKNWLEEAGGNIEMNFEVKGEKERITRTDETNPYWVAFKNAMDELGVQVQPSIRLGNSDSRFVRRENISALGFAPLFNTISRRHDHNEYINAAVYLKGINIVKNVIIHLGNV